MPSKYTLCNNGLVFKPLFPITRFNKLLTATMEAWSVMQMSSQSYHEYYDDIILLLVKLYGMVIALPIREYHTVHPGNFEYLLTVFDKMQREPSSSPFMRLIIKQIKRKIIEFL